MTATEMMTESVHADTPPNAVRSLLPERTTVWQARGPSGWSPQWLVNSVTERGPGAPVPAS